MKNKKRTLVTVLTAFFLVGGLNFAVAEDEKRSSGPRGGGERPDFFALADLDENGTISLQELVDSRMQMMQRRMERGGSDGQRGGDMAQMKERITERMTTAFKQADADENGELSRAEFDEMPKGRGGPGGNRGKKKGGKKSDS